MVDITCFHDRISLEVQGFHKVWALKSRLEIPIEHVIAVHADPHPAMGWFQGLKLAGTDIPHIFRAGLFWQEGNKVFWDVRHPENTIVLDLEDESIAKLVVEVTDVSAAIEEIEAALAHYRAARIAAEKEVDSLLAEPAFAGETADKVELRLT